MPQRFKLRRGGEKARQFVFPRRIAAVLGHRGAEIGDEGRQHIAIFDPAAPGLMGQIEINAVAIFFREGGEIDAHQAAEAVVPRHNIKVRFLNAGRLRHQAVQHPAGARADAFAHRHLGGFRRGQPGEHEQMPGLQRTALQGIRHPHQHRLRRIHLPPLLQPGVPGNADVGEHRHLFPAQTRRAPAAHPGQPQALRIEAFTAGAQKGPQLFASIVRHGDRRLPLRHRGHHPSSIVVPIPV